MSLSTSNSKNFRNAIVTVCVLLVAFEIVLRTVIGYISLDILHLNRIPAIAAKLKKHNRSILFMGNSLTRAGIRADMVEEMLRASGFSHVRSEAVYPDDTTLRDWYYLYKYHFVRNDASPAVLVVSFARDQLSDKATIHPQLIAGYFGGISVMGELFRKDVSALDDRVNYLLSCASVLLANRDRIKDRIMTKIIPGYKQAARHVNNQMRAKDNRKKFEPSYGTLGALARECSYRGTLFIVAAMPIENEYRLDPGVADTVIKYGGIFIDMRDKVRFESASFTDKLHLSPEGARAYTREFMKEIMLKKVMQNRLQILSQKETPEKR